MAVEPAAAALTTPLRSWRTAFLTLRDETLCRSTGASSTILPLLDDLILSHSHSLIAAAPYLPPHEATSDLMYLLNLATTSVTSENSEHAFSVIFHLIHGVTLHVLLELSSSAWAQMLDFFCKLAQFLLGNATTGRHFSGTAFTVEAVMCCLKTTRHLICVEQRRHSLSDNIQLVKFLLNIIPCCHAGLNGCSHSSGDRRCNSDSRKTFPQRSYLCKVQTLAFTMVDEAFSRLGSSFPIEIWQSTIEVLRKIMDASSTKIHLVEDDVLSRFYASLLHCLHVVLVNRKCNLSDHVPAFVATLRVFLVYGINKTRLLSCHSNRDLCSLTQNMATREIPNVDSGRYRPPHLRKKNRSMQQTEAQSCQTSSGHECPPVEFLLSDSDYSDSDGNLKDFDNVHCVKARVAAITCIQDLCEADPKAFTAQWVMLLPTCDVLQPRKNEATLMSSLLFDPCLKARLASASAIAAMLDGRPSVSLQVAEYRESTKSGSYTSLSCTLGQILMQLHTGVLHLIQHEKHAGLMVSVFKILMLLTSCTPYSRMPEDLLPTVLSCLRLRIEDGFPFKSDQTSLLAMAINCLSAAVSTLPACLRVHQMFQTEIATGVLLGQGVSGVLVTLFQNARQVTNPTVSFEALQALKAVCHNYPDIMAGCWKEVSAIVYQFLRLDTFDVTSRKGCVGFDVGSTVEKVVAAAIKVVDECLRAICGFKGTEDLFGDKLSETPFTADFIRDKKISSAPVHGGGKLRYSKGSSNGPAAGCLEWTTVIEEHLSLSICHGSALVRAASITCFAGITSSVFVSLEKEKQRFILYSCINAALKDTAPSVRSAACRAIGVIACFPEIFRSAEIFQQFFDAVENNTSDHLVSVRITASWAVANICDSLRHCVSDSSLEVEAKFEWMALLLECALRLTKDGDKVKSNAVRALGYLSRIVPFSNLYTPGARAVSSLATSSAETSPLRHCLEDQNIGRSVSNAFWPHSLGHHFLGRIVQAFLSCITTGNVKVQWNVCHALSNLFLNETLQMQYMDWAPSVYSILLLLLRDSQNFKIRIQATAALAVPSSVPDYGASFSDIVQGVEHVLENLATDHNLTPSFKYMIALEKQLTATMLHLLGLCSSNGHEPLIKFLVKKASFFEEWFEILCVSLEETSSHHDNEEGYMNQKKRLVSKAIRSLIEVYEDQEQRSSTRKLAKLLDCLSRMD